MVTILREHIAGYPRTSGRGRLTSLTVHQTGNTGRGANARAHANLQARGAMPRNSWHATVDATQAIESYPDDAKCWHAGNATGNASSYAVELCVNSDGNYARMLTNAAEFIAKKLHDLGLDPGDVVQHNHWSGKDCPTQIRAGQGGVTWTRFLGMIRDAYDGTPTTPDTSEEDPDMAFTDKHAEMLERIDAAIRNGSAGSHTDGAVTSIIKTIAADTAATADSVTPGKKGVRHDGDLIAAIKRQKVTVDVQVDVDELATAVAAQIPAAQLGPLADSLRAIADSIKA